MVACKGSATSIGRTRFQTRTCTRKQGVRIFP